MQITKQAWFLLSHLYLVPRSEETRSVGISWHILQPTKDHALSVFNMLGFYRDPKQVFFWTYGHIERLQDKILKTFDYCSFEPFPDFSSCWSVIQAFGWSASSNIWCKCVSLHKFDLHYFVSMISILYEYDLRIILRIIWVRSAWRKVRVLTILA